MSNVSQTIMQRTKFVRCSHIKQNFCTNIQTLSLHRCKYVRFARPIGKVKTLSDMDKRDKQNKERKKRLQPLNYLSSLQAAKTLW